MQKGKEQQQQILKKIEAGNKFWDQVRRESEQIKNMIARKTAVARKVKK